MVRNQVFSPIIERNTVIPASRVHVYSTFEDNQRRVLLPIYQGESRSVIDNIRLGEIAVNVPAAPAGAIAIEVRFSYDINGLFEVDVHVPKTGERLELVIADDDVMSSSDFQKHREALAALKHHPRDSDLNRTIMARAARCYEDSLGDARHFIGQHLDRFSFILERQDPREIEHARTELTQILDQFEGETWL